MRTGFAMSFAMAFLWAACPQPTTAARSSVGSPDIHVANRLVASSIGDAPRSPRDSFQTKPHHPEYLAPDHYLIDPLPDSFMVDRDGDCVRDVMQNAACRSFHRTRRPGRHVAWPNERRLGIYAFPPNGVVSGYFLVIIKGCGDPAMVSAVLRHDESGNSYPVPLKRMCDDTIGYVDTGAYDPPTTYTLIIGIGKHEYSRGITLGNPYE